MKLKPQVWIRRLAPRAARYLGVLLVMLAVSSQAQPAFSGAEGFGALATGGRGGEIRHVTNLDDAGPGSLREAVGGEKRFVVFDVGGVIRIKTPLVVSSHITLAGQSAPAPGITIYGQGVSFSNRQNIIVRYLRLRQGIGGARGGKVINVSAGSNMIFDHVSAQWGRWDTLGFTQGTSRMTVQDCLLGESIDPQRFGGFVDSSTDITLCRNLWIDNQSRNPKAKANLQYINNIVYNWGGSGVTGGHSAAVWHQDMLNNAFIKGPSSSDNFLALFASTDYVHQSGNVADLDRDGVLKGRPIVAADFAGETPPTFQGEPFNTPPVPVPILTIQQAYDRVIASAGASLVRDAVDTRLIKQVTSLGAEGAIVHNEAEAGGQPDVPMTTRPASFDTDRDGIPDDWESAHGLNPRDPADSIRVAGGDGVTNLEKYLDSLVPKPAR